MNLTALIECRNEKCVKLRLHYPISFRGMALRDRKRGEICPLLVYYAALSGSSVPTFRDFLTLENGTDKLSRNVGTELPTLRNIPEERRSHLHGGGSLKSYRKDGAFIILSLNTLYDSAHYHLLLIWSLNKV
jgi:hypothetical protein